MGGEFCYSSRCNLSVSSLEFDHRLMLKSVNVNRTVTDIRYMWASSNSPIGAFRVQSLPLINRRYSSSHLEWLRWRKGQRKKV